MAIILAAAVSLPALYVADGYVASDYSDDIRAQVSSTAIPSTLVRDQDTIGIFPVSTTLSGAGLTQAAGAQTDVEGNALFAPTYVTSTGMASSGSATMLMPFGMSKDAAAVPIALYMDADYVAPDYVETIRSVLSYVDVGVTKISEPLILPVASSATDIAVTQVHTFGAASEAVSTHLTAGSRIESTGMLSSATSTTLIPTTRVASTGYKSDATSATDVGSASIKSAGYKAEGTATTIVGPKYTVGFGVKVESQSTALAAGKMTAVFGVKVEATGTTIIASRLKWEPVEEPTDIWTTINDDSYPFG